MERASDSAGGWREREKREESYWIRGCLSLTFSLFLPQLLSPLFLHFLTSPLLNPGHPLDTKTSCSLLSVGCLRGIIRSCFLSGCGRSLVSLCVLGSVSIHSPLSLPLPSSPSVSSSPTSPFSSSPHSPPLFAHSFEIRLSSHQTVESVSECSLSSAASGLYASMSLQFSFPAVAAAPLFLNRPKTHKRDREKDRDIRTSKDIQKVDDTRASEWEGLCGECVSASLDLLLLKEDNTLTAIVDGNEALCFRVVTVDRPSKDSSDDPSIDRSRVSEEKESKVEREEEGDRESVGSVLTDENLSDLDMSSQSEPSLLLSPIRPIRRSEERNSGREEREEREKSGREEEEEKEEGEGEGGRGRERSTVSGYLRLCGLIEPILNRFTVTSACGLSFRIRVPLFPSSRISRSAFRSLSISLPFPLLLRVWTSFFTQCFPAKVEEEREREGKREREVSVSAREREWNGFQSSLLRELFGEQTEKEVGEGEGEKEKEKREKEGEGEEDCECEDGDDDWAYLISSSFHRQSVLGNESLCFAEHTPLSLAPSLLSLSHTPRIHTRHTHTTHTHTRHTHTPHTHTPPADVRSYSPSLPLTHTRTPSTSATLLDIQRAFLSLHYLYEESKLSKETHSFLPPLATFLHLFSSLLKAPQFTEMYSRDFAELAMQRDTLSRLSSLSLPFPPSPLSLPSEPPSIFRHLFRLMRGSVCCGGTDDFTFCLWDDSFPLMRKACLFFSILFSNSNSLPPPPLFPSPSSLSPSPLSLTPTPLKPHLLAHYTSLSLSLPLLLPAQRS